MNFYGCRHASRADLILTKTSKDSISVTAYDTLKKKKRFPKSYRSIILDYLVYCYFW